MLTPPCSTPPAALLDQAGELTSQRLIFMLLSNNQLTYWQLLIVLTSDSVIPSILSYNNNMHCLQAATISVLFVSASAVQLGISVYVTIGISSMMQIFAGLAL